jgi:dipeptidyl aminopeptidase/acylaminoacyl peptidase
MLVAALVLSCSADPAPRPALPAPAPSPAPPAPASAPAPAASAAPDPSAPVAPTVLTDAQRKRDDELTPRAATVVDAFMNSNGFFATLAARWSPDGKKILFGSTRDGAPQIYLGDPARPGGAPVRVTTGPDRVLSAVFTRDGKSILFPRDDKGDEQYALWRVGLDGSGAVNLTPGERLQRGTPILPTKTPTTMFYDGAPQSEPTFRVFEQSLDGGDPKVVYTSTEPGGLADVADDGSRALVVVIRSFSDQVVFELDVATGKTRRLYPPEGKTAAIQAIRYSADGKRVLVSTDEGTESSVLLAIDPASGKELARYVNDVSKGLLDFDVAPTGDRVAVRIDAGNHGEARILDARTLRVQRAVKLPLADVGLGSFREDGRAFSLVLSLPSRPPDVFEVNAATGAVRPLRADRRAGLDDLGAIDASIQSIPAFDGLTIPVNQYLPKVEPGKKLPVIAMFHGGPATSYAVRWNPYARFFVSLGYAVVEPNVRGSTGFGRAYERADDREKRADWLKDVESVNAWTKSQPWCDPDRVVVWGQSYGGYTTLMALTRQPTLWRAGVDLYGPADLRKFLLTTDGTIRKVFVNEFGDVDRDADLLERFSPMRDVGRIVAPLFVYQGQNDPRVPRTEGDAIVRALRARGVPVEYMVAPNEGHAVDHHENRIELLARTARFFEENVKAR